MHRPVLAGRSFLRDVDKKRGGERGATAGEPKGTMVWHIALSSPRRCSDLTDHRSESRRVLILTEYARSPGFFRRKRSWAEDSMKPPRLPQIRNTNVFMTRCALCYSKDCGTFCVEKPSRTIEFDLLSMEATWMIAVVTYNIARERERAVEQVWVCRASESGRCVVRHMYVDRVLLVFILTFYNLSCSPASRSPIIRWG